MHILQGKERGKEKGDKMVWREEGRERQGKERESMSSHAPPYSYGSTAEAHIIL